MSYNERTAKIHDGLQMLFYPSLFFYRNHSALKIVLDPINFSSLVRIHSPKRGKNSKGKALSFVMAQFKDTWLGQWVCPAIANLSESFRLKISLNLMKNIISVLIKKRGEFFLHAAQIKLVSLFKIAKFKGNKHKRIVC